MSELAFTSPSELAGLNEKTPVLLAFSGGVDSRVLLELLLKDSAQKGYRLFLAHVNHGIRGEDALRDARFCERTAAAYGLELFRLDVDVPALAAQNRRGLEEEAREVRYAFFEELMREREIPLLATAHHADDNLETLLFRLARGATAQGLGGIASVRAFASGFLTRPLLRATRADILAYAKENRIEYVSDATNADTQYARNRLRAEAVPVLEALFPGVQRRTSTLCEELREDEALLQSLAARLIEEARDGTCLRVSVMRRAHPSLLRRALRVYLAEQTQLPPERAHVCAAEALILSSKNGGETSLLRGYRAVIEGDRLRVLAPQKEGAGDYVLPFAPGRVQVPSSKISISVLGGEENRKINNLYTTACINLTELSAIMKGVLYWRNRRPGDTLCTGGMHKRLRKLYNQKGIPPRLRERMPLLCDSSGIVWAPFVGVRDGVATNGELTVCVELSQDDALPRM